MQVLHDQQNRPCAGQCGETPGKRVEEAPLVLLRLERRGERDHGQPRGQLGHKLNDGGDRLGAEAVCHVRKLLVAKPRVQQVGERGVRERAIGFEAVACQNTEAEFDGVLSGRGDQARLPDASLAGDQDGLASPAASPVQPALEHGKVGVAADEDRTQGRSVKPRHRRRRSALNSGSRCERRVNHPCPPRGA